MVDENVKVYIRYNLIEKCFTSYRYSIFYFEILPYLYYA